MIVCICQGVSDRVIRLVVATGATTVDAVGSRCGAGTDCGACLHAIADVIDEAGHHQRADADRGSAAPRQCVSATAELSSPVADAA